MQQCWSIIICQGCQQYSSYPIFLKLFLPSTAILLLFHVFFVGVPAPTANAAPAQVPDFSQAAAPAAVDGKASDDLLQLAGNPFANMLNGKLLGCGAPLLIN